MLQFPFPLERPLTWVDLETTGKDPLKARIVEIGLIQFKTDAEPVTYSTLVNPEEPIPAGATEKHGITDDMVKDKPTWAQLAPSLVRAFRGCDIAGYNVARYDMAVLKAEFGRAGISTELKSDEPAPRILDGFKLWQITDPRTLTDYVRVMLGETHEGAHRADADILMTARAVVAHLERVAATLPVASLQALHDLQFPTNPNAVDRDGKVAWFEGPGGTKFAALTFGKYAEVPLVKVPRSYWEWALGPRGLTDLSVDTRSLIVSAKHGTFPVPPQNVGTSPQAQPPSTESAPEGPRQPAQECDL